MSKVKLSEPFESISGSYGSKYFLSTRGTKTILSRRRKKGAAQTEQQKAHQERFREAIRYATFAKDDPVKWAWYHSLQDPDHSAFNMAVADFLSLPVVQQIDTSSYLGHADEIILLTAYDKFRVVGVTVSIHGPDGTLIEEGPALRRDKTSYYCYLTTLENPDLPGTVITAVATDMAGHKVELSKTL